MAAETGRYVMLVALEVTDAPGYARYRAAMTPILESYGGSFEHDFVVAEVLRGAGERINRVFTISFPDRRAKERFFADDGYLAVRAAHFEPAVAGVEVVQERVVLHGDDVVVRRAVSGHEPQGHALGQELAAVGELAGPDLRTGQVGEHGDRAPGGG